jgi:hypothetical protein
MTLQVVLMYCNMGKKRFVRRIHLLGGNARAVILTSKACIS